MTIVHGILQAGILEWVTYPSPEDLPDPGIELGSPALQANSLPAELPGKSQNYKFSGGRLHLLYCQPAPREVSGICMCVLVIQSCCFVTPMDCSPPGSTVHGILQAGTLELVRHFLLQRIFLTQGSNLGLMHCSQILYQLSHQRRLSHRKKKKKSVKVQRSQDKLESIIQMVWEKQVNNFSYRLY